MSKTALSGVNRILLRKVAHIIGADRRATLKMKTGPLVEEIIKLAPDATPEMIQTVVEIPELSADELAAVKSVLAPEETSSTKKSSKAKAKGKARRTRTKTKPAESSEPSEGASPGHDDIIMRLDALGSVVDDLTELVKSQAEEIKLLKAGLTTVVCCVFDAIDDLSELTADDEGDTDPDDE